MRITSTVEKVNEKGNTFTHFSTPLGRILREMTLSTSCPIFVLHHEAPGTKRDDVESRTRFVTRHVNQVYEIKSKKCWFIISPPKTQAVSKLLILREDRSPNYSTRFEVKATNKT